MKKRWLTNLSKVEIEITTNCNLRCFNCNRSVRQAPSNEMMSVAQIKRFIKESLELGWHWEYIGLAGGEPTLHPNFFEIIDLLKKYREETGCIIEVVTNGHGDEVLKKLMGLPVWVQIRNSGKETIVSSFFPYNEAPRDTEDIVRDYSKGCQTTFECGLGLTRYGYYPCGAGASVDRVLGWDIGIKRLDQVTAEKLKDQLSKVCEYCGQFLRDYNKNVRITEEKISPSWIEAYKKYKYNKSRLTLY